MKKILLLLAVSMLTFTSCYDDNATFTVKITGYAQSYSISYRDQSGQWVENVTVSKDFAYYNEHSDDWKLDLVVVAPDSIFVQIFKRGDLKQVIKGKDNLEIHKTINH